MVRHSRTFCLSMPVPNRRHFIKCLYGTRLQLPNKTPCLLQFSSLSGDIKMVSKHFSALIIVRNSTHHGARTHRAVDSYDTLTARAQMYSSSWAITGGSNVNFPRENWSRSARGVRHLAAETDIFDYVIIKTPAPMLLLSELHSDAFQSRFWGCFHLRWPHYVI